MNEIVLTPPDRMVGDWGMAPADDPDPREQLCEFIIGPEPISEDRYEEGVCD
jgi:hypothetical protein